MKHSPSAVIAELARELMVRRNIYPKWITEKKISPSAAGQGIKDFVRAIYDYAEMHSPLAIPETFSVYPVEWGTTVSNADHAMRALNKEYSKRKSYYPLWINLGKIKMKVANERLELLEQAITELGLFYVNKPKAVQTSLFDLYANNNLSERG